MSVCVHKCVHTCRGRCLPQLLPTLPFETESLIEAATNSARLTSQQALGILLWPPLQCWDFRNMALHFVMLYKFWVTNALVLVQQALF